MVSGDRPKWPRTEYLLQRIDQWGEMVPEADYSTDWKAPLYIYSVTCRAANGDTETFRFQTIEEARNMVEFMEKKGLGMRTGSYRKVEQFW